MFFRILEKYLYFADFFGPIKMFDIFLYLLNNIFILWFVGFNQRSSSFSFLSLSVDVDNYSVEYGTLLF